MFQEVTAKICATAVSKRKFAYQKPFAHFVACLMGGAFIGLGAIFMTAVGQLLPPAQYPSSKFIAAGGFSVALALIVMAGAELFTGNHLVYGLALLDRKISVPDALKLWGVNWLGNLGGSLILAFLYHASGLIGQSGDLYLTITCGAKTNIDAFPLFARAILCNIMVCLAVWCVNKMSSESGKLTIIFLAIFAFVSSGFEHSVANMSFLTLGMMRGCCSFSGAIYNLIVVSLGNLFGAFVLLACPYYLISHEKKEPQQDE